MPLAPRRLMLLSLLLPACAPATLQQAAADQAPTVAPASRPASGVQSFDLTVPSVGRYALLPAGGQGTALTLVDRLVGPIASDGVAGQLDGRLDVFLEPGTWRVRTASAPGGTGDLSLQVRPFVEVDPAATPTELPDAALVTSTLPDLASRTWWFTHDTDDAVVLEAAGRALGDLRVWRDGLTLQDAAPDCATVSPTVGHPVTRCTLTTALAQGTYAVVAYGAPALPWTDGAADSPLWIRRGLPTLPPNGGVSATVSPLGLDRYRFTGKQRVRFELPAPAEASLAATPSTPAQPLQAGGDLVHLAPDSRRAIGSVWAGDDADVLTVTGTPGQAYALQGYTPAGETTALATVGPTYVTTLPTGNPADELDVTGLLLVSDPKPRVAASQTLPLTPTTSWRRTFNLPSAGSVYVTVETAGTWHVGAAHTAGGAARWRLTPFLLEPAATGTQVPAFRAGEGDISLNAGTYRLDLEPTAATPVRLTLRGERAAEPQADAAPLGALTFPSVDLPRGSSPRLLLGHRASGGTGNASTGDVGLYTHALPLASPVPVPLAPGASVALSVRVSDRGTWSASPGLLAVDGGAASPTVTVAKGIVHVTVSNPGTAPILALVGPAPVAPSTTPVPFDVPTPDEPAGTLLTTAAPVAFDLAQGAVATFRVRVDEPGAYTIETTGLLATNALLRTRVGTVIAEESTNGAGRNARLQALLTPGVYLCDVTAMGSSAGHLGITLTADPTVAGGTLGPGQSAGLDVPGGAAARVDLEIPEAGTYAVDVRTLAGSVPLRLEDADGWPLVRVGRTNLPDTVLPAGTAHLVQLPMPMSLRRITRLTRVAEPVPLTGHGPHALPLAAPASATWWEPAEGAADRPADTWTFALPASGTATVRISDGMTADLHGPTGALLGTTRPEAPWRGALASGAYTLEARAARVNSGVPYTISVDTDELLPGEVHPATSGSRIPVTIGADGLYTLRTTGDADVTLRLTDADGQLVGAADDDAGDWNPAVTRRLAPGRYTAEVRSLRGAWGGTVGLVAVPERTEGALATGQAHVVVTDGSIVRPLTVPADGLLTAHLTAEGPFVAALEAQGGGTGGWRTVDVAEGHDVTLRVRLGLAGAQYRLRLTATHPGGADVQTTISVMTPTSTAAFSSAAASPTGAPVTTRGVAPTGALPSALVAATAGTIRVCPAPGEACVPLPTTGEAVALPPGTPWFVADADNARVRAVRLVARPAAGTPAKPDASALAIRLAGAGVAAEVPVDVPRVSAPTLLEIRATAPAGQPSLSALTPAGAAPQRGALHSAPVPASSPHTATLLVPLTPGGSLPTLTVRTDTPGAPVTLTARLVPLPSDAPALGEHALPPGAAVALRSPDRPVDVVLSRGAVAVLPGSASTGLTVASDASPSLLSSSGRGPMWLYNPTVDTVQVRVTAAPRAPTHGPTSSPEAWILDAAGTLLLAVDAPSGPLHLRGDAGPTALGQAGSLTAELIAADGARHAGPDLPATPGTLVLTHPAGRVLAWTGADALPDLFGTAPAEPAALDALLPVNGNVARWTTTVAGPGVLRIQAPGALLAEVRVEGHTWTGLVRPSGEVDVPVLPGATLAAPGAAGVPVEIVVRAPLAAPLRASAVLSFTEAGAVAAPPAAAAPPSVPTITTEHHLLAPGGVVAWRIDAPARPIGLVVGGSVASVDASLYDPTGALVGTGALLYPTASAGPWLVVVRAHDDAPPPEVWLTVAGLTEPPTTADPATIRRYAQLAGLVPPDPPPPPQGAWSAWGDSPDTGGGSDTGGAGDEETPDE